MVLELISGDVLVKHGAVLFWTKQPKSTMLMCHEFCSVENKFLAGSYCNGRGSQRGTCVAATIPLRVSLTICGTLKLLVVCNIRNALWILVYGTSTYFASLFGAAQCPLSHWDWCILREYIQLRGRTSSCSPTHKLTISLKTATIPTYHGISIAVTRYIAMQHPSLHYMTWCRASLPYSLLDHWVSVPRGLPHV